MPRLKRAQEGYALGIKKDVAREAVPQNGVWNLQDFIPDRLDAPLRKRGGWTGLSGLALDAYITGGVFAPFATGSKLVLIGSAGTLGYASAATLGSWTTLAGVAVAQNPIFHRELAIVAPSNLANRLKKFDGAAFADLHATAPQARYATVYRDRVAAANLSGAPNRVQFGPDGNPAAIWDTTFSWLDSSFEVRGIYGLRNSLLVFHDGSVEIIRGAIPPGVANSDMELEPLFAKIGLVDARSIVGWQENVIWASREGVYMTDGAVPLDLTKAGGIKDFWRERMASWTSSYTVAAGEYSGLLIISITDGAGAFVDCLVCDLFSRSWMRFKNFPFTTFISAVGVADETYVGRRDAGSGGYISSILSPAAGNKNDGNGSAVLPVLETGFLRAPELARWYEMHLGYDLRDAAADNPLLRVSYSLEPEGEAYTLSGDLDESTGYRERRLPLRAVAPGVAFKIEQTAASADTRLYGIKLRVEELEGGRIYG